MCATCGWASETLEHELFLRSQPDFSRSVALEVELLAKNDGLAAANRSWLAERGVTAVNLMGGPGAGKTALLEATIGRLKRPLAVVEGDPATDRDARRIRARGCRALQVQTGKSGHLDAAMLSRVLSALEPLPGSLVVIENVGSLVSPALFDLGEAARVVVLSVTEGDDKPEKYPHMFRAVDALVLAKIDLLPYVRFDVAGCVAEASRMNPRLEVFPLSVKEGEGVEEWCSWLEARVA